MTGVQTCALPIFAHRARGRGIADDRDDGLAHGALGRGRAANRHHGIGDLARLEPGIVAELNNGLAARPEGRRGLAPGHSRYRCRFLGCRCGGRRGRKRDGRGLLRGKREAGNQEDGTGQNQCRTAEKREQGIHAEGKVQSELQRER